MSISEIGIMYLEEEQVGSGRTSLIESRMVLGLVPMGLDLILQRVSTVRQMRLTRSAT